MAAPGTPNATSTPSLSKTRTAASAAVIFAMSRPFSGYGITPRGKLDVSGRPFTTERKEGQGGLAEFLARATRSASPALHEGRASSAELPLQEEPGRLGTIGHVELLEDVLQMELHGVLAYRKPLGDAGIRKSFGDQREKLALALREAAQRVRRGGGRSAAPARRAGKHQVAMRDVADGGDGLARRIRLQREAVRLLLPGKLQRLAVAECGQDEHLQGKPFAADLLEAAAAVLGGHLQIEDGQVGLETAHGFHQPLAIRRGGHHLEIGLALEEPAQPLENELVIVRQHDAGGMFDLGRTRAHLMTSDRARRSRCKER